jgi:uncharacterized protein (TIGR00369 family)
MNALDDRIKRGEVNPPIAQLLGFRIVASGDGRATVQIDAGERHWNPMGGVHGGVFCDVADAAMGIAYVSTLNEGEKFTTVELKINFLRPVRRGKLIAEGYVVSRGRSMGLVECDVRDEEGRLVAKAASTCLTLRDRDGAAGGK